MSRDHRILWGITGSVAAIRAADLAAQLLQLGEVKAVVTEPGKHFLDELPPAISIFDDRQEWSQWSALGDPVLHIELRKWADLFLIAPLTANSMAKLATGICDNLLSSVGRAWDFAKPMVVAPAMNTKMWEHPVTASQRQLLESWGAVTVEPVVKELACADVGIGALAPPETIAAKVRELLVAGG